jgi:DNA-binding CsgD family transcriptional regulator
MSDIHSLEDDIYEAAFEPAAWPSILHKVAQAVDAEGALLANISSPFLPWFASDEVRKLYDDFYSGGWAYENAKTRALVTTPHRGFISDADHLSDEWMSQQSIYKDFLWPRGFGYAAGTLVESPGSVRVGFSVEFKKTRGPASAGEIRFLDTLRPHLSRAAIMAHRLEFAKVEAALEALQLAAVPAAMIQHNGKLLKANPLFADFEGSVDVIAHNRLRFANVGASAFYEQLVHSGQRHKKGRSFPLPSTEKHPPAVLHFIPVNGSARELFLQASYFILITPARRKGLVSAELLRGLYDLSPAEARVAEKLAEGKVISQIALADGVSTETVRSHVKAILRKSGLSGQREFVAQLASIPSLR